jgi:hypothetical protein
MQACMQNGLELDKNEINCLLYGSTPNHINYFCFEIHKKIFVREYRSRTHRKI